MMKKKETPDEMKKEIPEEILPEAELKPVASMTLEEKVLDYINKHPDGVKITDMEKPFGEKRMKLGFVAKKLLDDGRILKIETNYYPKPARKDKRSGLLHNIVWSMAVLVWSVGWNFNIVNHFSTGY